MTVIIIFKSSAIRVQFKCFWMNLPMITVFLKKIKNFKCSVSTVPNYYAKQGKWGKKGKKFGLHQNSWTVVLSKLHFNVQYLVAKLFALVTGRLRLTLKSMAEALHGSYGSPDIHDALLSAVFVCLIWWPTLHSSIYPVDFHATIWCFGVMSILTHQK